MKQARAPSIVSGMVLGGGGRVRDKVIYKWEVENNDLASNLVYSSMVLCQ